MVSLSPLPGWYQAHGQGSRAVDARVRTSPLPRVYQPHGQNRRLVQGWHAVSFCIKRLVPTLPTWPTCFSPAWARAHTYAPARARVRVIIKQVNQVNQVGTKFTDQQVSACQPCTNLPHQRLGWYTLASVSPCRPGQGPTTIVTPPTPSAWQRVNRYLETHPSGYRISAAYNGTRWQFTAWSPEAEPELNFWQWRAKQTSGPCYALGEPTPARRACLGIHATATLARAACEAHAAASATLALAAREAHVVASATQDRHNQTSVVNAACAQAMPIVTPSIAENQP